LHGINLLFNQKSTYLSSLSSETPGWWCISS